MSVGHVARILESHGIPTVIIAVDVFRPHLQKMRVPRLVATPYFIGRPLGLPGDTRRQREILLAALRLLTVAKAGDATVAV